MTRHTDGVTTVPDELRPYLSALTALFRDAVGPDLVGAWLIGSAAQDAYEHGVSDVDVLAVTRSRHPEEARARLGRRVVHPTLRCPTVGLEFVWYALPDLKPLGDPVAFQLNVNGGLARPSVVQLAPDGPNHWAVLDLAAARQVGVRLGDSPPAKDALPPVPDHRVAQAIRESLAWHDGPDAGSPNRVLNLARLLVLVEDGTWLSKQAGAQTLVDHHPEFADAVAEALRARTERRWMDPRLADPLSALLLDRLG